MMRLVALLPAALLLAGCPAPPGPKPPPAPSVRFEDVAAPMGVTFVCGETERTPLDISELMAGGVGWLDADQDGWLDLVLAGPKGVRLYLNQAGRAFRDATAGSGLQAFASAPQGVAAADYDGDGRTDLLVTLLDGATLFRCTGPGKFQDVTQSAGIGLRGWASSAAFADVDGDGRLDLYVGRYLKYRPDALHFRREGDVQLTLGPSAYAPDRGVLYRNLGNGRFQDVTDLAGLSTSHGKTLGTIFADYDADGDQDLYLANDQALCDLYRNGGGGRFTDVAQETGTATGPTGIPQSGMGVDWVDANGDERLDLFVTTFHDEVKSLYRQERDGLFTEASRLAGLLPGVLRWTAFGAAFEDWNNDGSLDLMVANGHVADQMDRVNPTVGYRQPTQMLVGDGGTFRDVSSSAGPAFAQRIVGRGLAPADFDRDGKMDCAIANLVGPPLLLRNVTEVTGSWVILRLSGIGPNRHGLGARIKLEADGRTQTRLIASGRSYLSALPTEAHFGLGTPSAVRVEVIWPSGARQELPTVRLTEVNEVTEPAAGSPTTR